MSTEKDPSIYNDRAAIGSADELDEYGVWVKSEPQDVSSLDFDDGDEPALALPDSEDLPDFDAGFDDTAVDFDDESTPEEFPPQPQADDEFAFPGEEEISFDDADHIPAISDEITIEDFDDLEAVRKDILEPQVTKSAPRTSGADLSTQLLMQIAEELNSIKGELSSLKSELAAVKIESQAAAHGSPLDAEELQAQPPLEAQAGSFFDEDDDETIALTGDELDNILHTADFTEEAGADAIEGLTEDDIAALNDSDFTVAKEFSPPPPSNEIDLSSLESRDTEELVQLRDKEAEPITEAPEDTSYLENDPLAKEHSEGLALDLSDAVIDEPDLSGGIVENPPEEPTADALDINLDDFGELSLDDETETVVSDETAVAIKSDPVESVDASETDASESFEEISFEDIGADAQTIDISSFDADSPGEASFPELSEEISLDDLGSGSGNDILAEAVPQEDLTFEMLGEDAELPIKENVQDNVITDDSFETISLDDTIDLAETPKTEEALDLIESITLEEAVVGLDNETADLDLDLGDTVELGDTIELPDSLDIPELEAKVEPEPESKPQADSETAPEDSASILGQILNQLDVTLPPAEEAPPAPEPEKSAEEGASAILGQILGQLENAPPPDAAPEPPAAEAPAPAPVEKAPAPVKKTPKPRAPSRKKAAKPKAEEIVEPVEESPINTDKIPRAIKTELKTVLSYMDQLLESLPEDKIEEFAQSEHFETYKKLFEDLGIA